LLLLTDLEIVKGCKRGQQTYQKALYDRYANYLFGVSKRYAHNAADAEDILQDSFIKVFNKIEQYSGAGSIQAWMAKIVVHTAIKKYKVSRYSKEFLVTDIAEVSKDEAYETNGYEHLTQKDLLQLIHNLPNGYRIVFNMYVIEGYPHEEIGEILGIQASTSRSQLAKAKSWLQKEIMKLQNMAIVV
jgi:RNA polymerase sigma factor (sigma-70 family)